MLGVSVALFLVAIAAGSTAAPFDNDVINIFDSFENDVIDIFNSFENDVNSFSNEDSSVQNDNDNACTDFFSFTCNKTNNEDLQQLKYKDHLAQLYSSEVYNVLIDVLNGEIEDGKNPIDIERTLYQSCMNLGNKDKKVKHEYTTDSTFKNMLQHFNVEIHQESWQELDQKLALQGFKHAFFEIDVVKDPESPNQNIIRLSPPSMTEWNFKKLTDVVSDIFTQQQLDAYDACINKQRSSDESDGDNNVSESDDDNSVFRDSSEEENDNDVSRNTVNENDNDGSSDVENEMESADLNELCPLVESIRNPRRELTIRYVREQEKTVMKILNQLLKGIFDTMDTSNDALKVQRTTIDKLNNFYKKYVKKDTAAIDWYQVIKSYFGNSLNIHVKNTEYILVDNVPYFVELAYILSDNTDEDIAHTIRSKFVGENMRYYNWNMVNDMNPVDKPSFCLEQNKFYAASAEVLKHLKLQMKPYEKKVESLLYDIVGVLHDNISSTHMSEIMRANLLSNLKDLTKAPFKTIDQTELSEYYEDFELTGDYLVDINSYKNMIRNSNLLRLRENSLSHHRSSPFSVLGTDNPRNRYVLHSALNAIIYKHKFLLNKDVLYGTFGVRTARFLFALLNENTFENDLRDLRGIASLIPRISYKPEQVACFINESVVKYGYFVDYDIITDVFGIRFAQVALQHHSKSQSTEEFFTAYTQDHCSENNSKMIKKVLSNVREFSSALKCTKNEDTACNLQAF